MNYQSPSLHLENQTELIALCPICTSSSVRCLYNDLSDYLLGHTGNFVLSRCTECKHEFLSKRPTEAAIEKYYTGNYYTHKPANLAKANTKTCFNSITNGAAKLWNMITLRSIENLKALPNQVVLDYGCGNGRTLYQMQKNGWIVKGFEPDVAAMNSANQLLGHGSVTNASDSVLRSDSYDIIILSHVIEHVHSPLQLLLKLKETLREDGTLVITTPLAGCLESQLFGKYWRGYECPRHIHVFSEYSLQKLSRQAGLDIIMVRPEMLPMCTVESIQISLQNKMNIKLPYLFLRLTYLIVYPISLGLMHLGISSSMKILLRLKKYS